MIKNILFDNNGVLTTSNSETVDAACARYLGVPKLQVSRAILHHAPPFDRGEISGREASRRVLRDLGITANAAKFSRIQLNAYISKPDVQRFAKELSKSYQIALLSNFGKPFWTEVARWKLLTIFDRRKMFVSCDLNMIKPNKNIFRFALKKLGWRASQTVFIDDNIDNVRTAKSLGMSAVQFKTLPQLKRELRKLQVTS